MPMPNNLHLGVTGVNPIDIAGAVKQPAQAVLNALTVADIRHDMGEKAA